MTDSRLQAFDLVIFDWAGTMVDFGCCAPVVALQEAFARRGVALAEADARADMGKAKRSITCAPCSRVRTWRPPGRRREAARPTKQTSAA